MKRCLPEGVNTRITLTLLDPSSFEQRADELRTLPDTLLLFLSKLQLLHIKIYPRNKKATEIIFTHTSHENKLETITKTTISDGKSTERNLDFYVLRRDIKDLPLNEARNNNGATVVLAFPVDVAKSPIVEKQLVYAFLPLKNLGFKFLIQSDFILQANREDVVHSERNKALLLGVAETFRDAVLHFCQQPILKYRWMRYLPDDSISDEFWTELKPLIVLLLKDTPMLLPWSETTLRLPSKVYYLPDWVRDKHGQPLFADSEEEEYLSPHYTSDDRKRLHPLGLKKIQWRNILARFCSDLTTKNPKMRVNNPIDEDWQTRVAQLFSKGLSIKVDWLCERIKSLELIPLQARTPVFANVKCITRWVTAENMPIYFPNTGNIPIPSDLGLALVEQTAASNNERKILFSQLGVINASSSDIVSLIIKRYTSLSFRTMCENIAHLQYLYWNLSHDTSDLARSIYLFDKDGQNVLCIQSHMEHMYFEEEEEDWQQLFKRSPIEDGEFSGPHLHFLNSKYIDAVSPTDFQHGRSWKQWLSEIVGVQRDVQLLNPNGHSLSDEFQYVIEHRPEKLVWLLKRFWHVYKHGIDRLPAVVSELSSCQVPSDGDVTETLGSTFLPLPRLMDLARGLEIVHFPFLTMPKELTEENGNDWQFLTAFGVTSSDDLDFYVNALYRVALEDKVGCEPSVLDALFKIYDALGKKCLNASDSTYIRNIFEMQKMIYIPSNGVRAAEWVISEACVWKGPEWLKTKRSLYGASKFPTCDQLFHVILKIPDAGWKEYLEDLKAMKLETHVHAAKVTDIYHRLWREFQDDSNSDFVRSLFETSQLVFVPSKNTWVNLSSCIWAEDEIRIPEKEPLKTAYLELEPFFHKILGIPKPDIKMHVQGLIKLAENQTQPSELEIKGLISVISALNPTADDVAELQSANIFFVKTQAGQKTRTNSAASFAIIDRSEYGAVFMGKINMLDYTMEEVNACKPLFHSLGMKKKYLSELVDEKTSVDDGEISTKLTESFRNKAYAFVRCKVHYSGAERKEENIALYQNLRNASIYVSNCIVKSMSVVQYGETITVEKSRANFHLEENDESLRLYVPQEENSRQICMNRQLPKRLTTFLHISTDPEAQLVITGVINCGTLDAVDGVLQDAGIVEVDGMVQSPDIAQKIYPSGNGANSSKDGTQAFVATTQTRTQSLGSCDGDPANTSAAALMTSFAQLSMEVPCRQPTVFGQSSGRSDLSPASPNQGLPSRLSPAESVCPERLMQIANPDIGYVSLLERAIQSASRITIPAQGIRSVDTLPSLVSAGDIPYVSIFAGRSVEADRMIGAAGELLVFEILNNLNLPEFSEENWQSTIRKEVRAHSKYRNLKPWQGRETADITYHDSEGCFTKLLIEKGYLEIDTWEDERPTYYLEVKTTKKTYDEKFFMSGAQYNRMQAMKLQPERATREIYVILRVFDLESRIGLQIYVDPEAAQLEGTLKFTVNTWEVKHTEVV